MTIYVYSNNSHKPVATFTGSSESECEKWAETHWGQQRVPLGALSKINREYFDGDRIETVTADVSKGEGSVVIYNSELLELETLAFCIVNRYGAADPAGDRLLYRRYTVSLPPALAKKPVRSETAKATTAQARGSAAG